MGGGHLDSGEAGCYKITMNAQPGRLFEAIARISDPALD